MIFFDFLGLGKQPTFMPFGGLGGQTPKNPCFKLPLGIPVNMAIMLLLIYLFVLSFFFVLSTCQMTNLSLIYHN